MRVKKYLAKTEKEAIDQIKTDLGSSAIILGTRKVKKGGFFGFFGKTMLEVTVACEPDNKRHEKKGSGLKAKDSLMKAGEGQEEKSALAGSELSRSEQEIKKEKFQRLKEMIDKHQKEELQPEEQAEKEKSNTQQLSTQTGETDAGRIANKTSTLQKEGGTPDVQKEREKHDQPANSTSQSQSDGHSDLSAALSGDIPGRNQQDAMHTSNQLASLQQELTETKSVMDQVIQEFRESSFQSRLPAVPRKYYQLLLEHDVVEEVAQNVINETMKKVPPDEVEHDTSFRNALKLVLKEFIDMDEGKELSIIPDSKIIVLVGPTGVGKTTTVAKLAAQYALLNKMDVGLITIDTYRIAAVEQLKTYADILSLPVEVVLTTDELKQAMTKFQDKEVILIDTAGRSHKNKTQMEELKTFMDHCQPSEIHLVLSLVTGYKDLQNIINNFQHINYQKFLLTKVDETESLGNAVNLLAEYQVGCSYLTNGQNVPDDLEVFQGDKIISRILGEDA